MFGNVADLLKKARKAAKKSQAEAAEASGISVRAIASWEGAEVSPKVEDFVRLMASYGIRSLDDFCRFVAEGETPQRTDEIREARPGRSAAYYREMADLLERLERLEGIVARDRK